MWHRRVPPTRSTPLLSTSLTPFCVSSFAVAVTLSLLPASYATTSSFPPISTCGASFLSKGTQKESVAADQLRGSAHVKTANQQVLFTVRRLIKRRVVLNSCPAWSRSGGQRRRIATYRTEGQRSDFIGSNFIPLRDL